MPVRLITRLFLVTTNGGTFRLTHEHPTNGQGVREFFGPGVVQPHDVNQVPRTGA